MNSYDFEDFEDSLDALVADLSRFFCPIPRAREKKLEAGPGSNRGRIVPEYF